MKSCACKSVLTCGDVSSQYSTAYAVAANQVTEVGVMGYLSDSL